MPQGSHFSSWFIATPLHDAIFTSYHTDYSPLESDVAECHLLVVSCFRYLGQAAASQQGLKQVRSANIDWWTLNISFLAPAGIADLHIPSQTSAVLSFTLIHS